MTKNQTDNKCKKCGEEIASDISICPYCGYELSSNFPTKKHSPVTLIIVFVVSVVFLFSFVNNATTPKTTNHIEKTTVTPSLQQNIGKYAYNSNSGAYVGVVIEYRTKCSQEKLNHLDCYVIDQGEMYNHKTIELPVEITDIKNISPTTP